MQIDHLSDEHVFDKAVHLHAITSRRMAAIKISEIIALKTNIIVSKTIEHDDKY